MSIIASVIIIGLAFLGESLFGFAGGLISIPLLTWLLGVKDAVTIVMIFQLMMGVLLIPSWRHIDKRAIKQAAPLVCCGTIIGALSLSFASIDFLNLLLLFLILSYLTKELLAPSFRLSPRLKTSASILGGFGGGFFQGIVGMGGPPFLIYLRELGLQKQAFRATIIMLLFISNVLRLLISVYSELFTPVVIEVVVYATPVFILDLVLGQRLHLNLSEQAYNKVVYIVLIISAALIYTKTMR